MGFTRIHIDPRLSRFGSVIRCVRSQPSAATYMQPLAGSFRDHSAPNPVLDRRCAAGSGEGIHADPRPSDG